MSYSPRPSRPTVPSLAAALSLVALAAGCSSTDPKVASGLEAPDMALEARYVVAVDVLDVGEGCVIGGLTPGGELAVATPVQSGADLSWSQRSESGSGLEWVLSGHVCPAGSGHTLRMFGGRIARLGDGDDAVCQVNLALPNGHLSSNRPDPNRCLDPRCSTLELVPDGCGGWVGEFEARLSYALDCVEQPDCVMHMRWHAVPDGADEGCTPDTSAANGAWMADCRTLP